MAKQKAQKQVDVVRRPSAAKIGVVPAKVQEFFEAKGKAVLLASVDPRVAARRGVKGQYPINTLELPEEEREELVAAARVAGFRPQSDGTLQLGDCILYEQSLQERDYHRLEAEKDAARMLGDERFEEQLAALDEETRSQAGGYARIVAQQGGGAGRHAVGGKEILRRAYGSG